MSSSDRFILGTGLQEYFQQEVTRAVSELNVDISQTTEFYIVNLLCDFSRNELGRTPGDEPLALQYKKALEADTAERAQRLKNLGDGSLYVAGFFTEFIERRLVDLDYYVSMGGHAYNSLSGLVGSQPNGDTFAELYQQMAAKFTSLVDVLNSIADQSQSNSGNSVDLLKTYDRWMRTGSERMRKRLLEQGLIPQLSDTGYVQ